MLCISAEDRFESLAWEVMLLNRKLKAIENAGLARIGGVMHALRSKTYRQLRAPRGIVLRERGCSKKVSTLRMRAIRMKNRDCYFAGFYDEDVAADMETGIRCRIRMQALSMIIHGPCSIEYTRATYELANTYYRYDLLEQAYNHVRKAKQLLEEIQNSLNDALTSVPMSLNFISLMEYVLSICYSNDSEVLLTRGIIIEIVEGWQAVATLEDSHENVADAHIQYLIKDIQQSISEHDACTLHQWLHFIFTKSLLCRATMSSLEEFSSVWNVYKTIFADCFKNGEQAIPDAMKFLHINELTHILDSMSESPELSICVHSISTALKRTSRKFHRESFTIFEVLLLGSHAYEIERKSSSQQLAPQISLLLSRCLLIQGKADEGLKHAQDTIEGIERLPYECPILLAEAHFAMAEALAVNFKDIWFLARQNTKAQARRRFYAAIDAAHTRSKKPMVEIKMTESYHNIPIINEAIDCAEKAFIVLQQARTHDATLLSKIKAGIALLHLSKDALHEAAQCFLSAILIIETECNGPVPASSLLRLDLAAVYDEQQSERQKGFNMYKEVASFYHQFAMRYSKCRYTKRTACENVMYALRQCYASIQETTPEYAEDILQQLYQLSCLRYGHVSYEAAAAAKELGTFMNQREEPTDNLFLRHASFVSNLLQ